MYASARANAFRCLDLDTEATAPPAMHRVSTFPETRLDGPDPHRETVLDTTLTASLGECSIPRMNFNDTDQNLLNDPSEVRNEMILHQLEHKSSRIDINQTISSSDVETGLAPPRSHRKFSNVVRTAMVVRNWLYSATEEPERRSDIDSTMVFEPQSLGNSEINNELNTNRQPSIIFEEEVSGLEIIADKLVEWKNNIIYFYVDPNGWFYYFWTTIVSIGVLYNMLALSIFIFDDVFLGYFTHWMFVNSTFDVIYLLDILIQARLTYLSDGSIVKNVRLLGKHYAQSHRLVFDILSLVPFDFLLAIRSSMSVVRVVRLFKVYRVVEFHEFTIKFIVFPAVFKILSVVTTCFVIFHWNACVYFLFSLVQGIDNATDTGFVFSYKKVFNPLIPNCDILLEDPDDACSFDENRFTYLDPTEKKPLNREPYIEELMEYWRTKSYTEMTFSNFTREYSMSMYWSSLTITTSGQQPWPENSPQNMLECVDTIIGLMVFSIIIGSVGNVVSVMNKERSEYQEKMDAVKFYMKYRNVNPAIQDRVMQCFMHMSSQHQLTDERDILECLPPRLQGQLAVNLHMDQLKKVELFQECEPGLLYELVLRLQQQIYSPNDYLCRAGDKAKQMFIVKRGTLTVVDDRMNPIQMLHDGSTFGELSVLHVPGNVLGDRRSVSLKSLGYSDIYILAQDDVTSILSEYPSARSTLFIRAREMLKRKNLLEEESIEPDEEIDHFVVLSLDEQLEQLAESIKHVDAQLNNIYDSFNDLSNQMKQRVTKLEVVYKNNHKRIKKDYLRGFL